MSAPKFGGGTKCAVCTKSVYANEELKFENKTYHKLCFKCNECKKVIVNLSGVAIIKGVVYDKNCFMKIFKTRGKYNDFGDDNLPKAEAERKKALSVSGGPDQTSPRGSVTEKPKPVSETKPVSESTAVPLVQLKKVGPPAEKSTQPVSPAAKKEEEAPKQEEEAPAKQVEIEEPVKESKEEAPVEKQEEAPKQEEEAPVEKPAEEAPAEKPAEEAPAEPVAEPVVDVEAPAADEPAPVEAAVEPAAEAEPAAVEV
jgi:hypothetical protein